MFESFCAVLRVDYKDKDILLRNCKPPRPRRHAKKKKMRELGMSNRWLFACAVCCCWSVYTESIHSSVHIADTQYELSPETPTYKRYKLYVLCTIHQSADVACSASAHPKRCLHIVRADHARKKTTADPSLQAWKLYLINSHPDPDHSKQNALYSPWHFSMSQSYDHHSSCRRCVDCLHITHQNPNASRKARIYVGSSPLVWLFVLSATPSEI